MEEGALHTAVQEGMQSPAYTDLLTALCAELKASAGLQESVTRPQGPDDAESFQLELRGLLRELQCPHFSLTADMHVLDSAEKRLLVLDYLVSEVLAARLASVRGQRGEEPEVNGDEVGVV